MSNRRSDQPSNGRSKSGVLPYPFRVFDRSHRVSVIHLTLVAFLFAMSVTSASAAIGFVQITTPDVDEKLKALHSSNSDESRKAAEELLELTKDFNEKKPVFKYSVWMSQVFRHAPELKQRKKAFAFLRKHFPVELEGVTRTIEIMVPNYPCVGGFQDSVRSVLYGEFDEVWLVTITRRRVPDRVEKSEVGMWGQRRPPTKLVLNIVASSDISEQSIVECLAESNRYDMESWSILVQTDVSDLLAKPSASDTSE